MRSATAFTILVAALLILPLAGATAQDGAPEGKIAATSSDGVDVTGSVKVMRKKGKRPLRSFANAVVYLTGRKTPPPATPAVIEQVKKTFVPRVLPVVQGQEVSYPNSDRVRHNVFCNDKRKSFDLGRYPSGQAKSNTFEEPGVYTIYCNIHQSMIADIVVLTNHYFAVTGKDGAFRIKNVPPGAYTLHVWHIYGGVTERPLSVGQGDVQLDTLVVTSTKVVRELEDHLDKDGQPYYQSDDSEY